MYTADRRRAVKARLVEHHGGKCLDCGKEFPPYIFHFDHRNPEEKTFNISNGQTYAYKVQLEESLKCDLVCGNCHSERTHRQRCQGCEYCVNDWDGPAYGGNIKEPANIEPCVCGRKKTPTASTCWECFIKPSKIDWPSLEELEKMLEKSNYVQVAKKLGVSDNAIRKHIKKLKG